MLFKKTYLADLVGLHHKKKIILIKIVGEEAKK